MPPPSGGALERLLEQFRRGAEVALSRRALAWAKRRSATRSPGRGDREPSLVAVGERGLEPRLAHPHAAGLRQIDEAAEAPSLLGLVIGAVFGQAVIEKRIGEPFDDGLKIGAASSPMPIPANTGSTSSAYSASRGPRIASSAIASRTVSARGAPSRAQISAR